MRTGRYDDCTLSFFHFPHDVLTPLSESTPDKPDWSNPWEILVGDGNMDYLVVEPTDATEAMLGRNSSGTFYWETDYNTAAENALQFFVGEFHFEERDNSRSCVLCSLTLKASM